MHKLIDFPTTAPCAKALVREVAREEKRLWASPLNCVSQSLIVTIKTHKDPPLLDVSFEVVTCSVARRGSRQGFSFEIELNVAMIGTIDPIHEERNPSGSSLKKSNPQSNHESPITNHALSKQPCP